MNREIYEEIMAPRRRLWERGGGTMHGVCEYLRKRHAERLARRAAGQPAERLNGRTVQRSNDATDFARKGAEGEAE